MIRAKSLLLGGLTLAAFTALNLVPGEAGQLSKDIELPQEAVFKKVLENGLTVLVKQSLPGDLVAIDVKIRAGSALEGEYAGSGISHLIEHMVFKGTKYRKAGDIEKEIKSYGGFINGSTSHDITSFQITVPAGYFKNALSVLEDMLANAVFENGEFEKEKKVVLKEIRLNNDEPQSRIMKFLYETSFLRHPYKYPVIGYEERLKRLEREELMRYYNIMYVPNRIAIAIVGGVDVDAAFNAVESTFKDFRAADYRAENNIAEPLQMGMRRLTQEFPTTLAYLVLGFHSTSILDKDLFALDVLSMILGRGDNSRLNKSLLKEGRIVHSVSSWNYTPSEPGLFVINAVLDEEKLDMAQEAILREIQRLKIEEISNDEIETAKRMVISDLILSRETIEGQASDICGNEMLTGNYDFSRRYVEGIQEVSKDDLKKVCSLYLTQDNMTIVRLVPPIGISSESLESKPTVIPEAKNTIIRKEILPNGLKILLREDKKIPAVSITVALSGGLAVEDRANNGISNLTAAMLLKGTHLRKEDEIRGAIERRGGNITHFSGFDNFGINVTILKNDIDFTMELIRDILSHSTFPQEELDREKTLVLAAIKAEDDDIFKKGSRVLRKSLFTTHPYAMRTIGEEGSVTPIKREEVLNFCAAYCVPNNIVISVSGDIEPKILSKRIGDIFGDMKQKEIQPIPIQDTKLDKANSQTLEMDKEESLVLMGFRTTGIKDKDRHGLYVLGSIMSGYSGRLFDELRDKLFLAYALGCVQKLGVETGYLVFYVATTKDKVPQAKKALMNEIRKIKTQLVEENELEIAKRELSSDHKIGMQTNGFFAFQSALDELHGLGYDELYKYEAGINKVTRKDIKRIVDKYLDLNGYREVLILSKE